MSRPFALRDGKVRVRLSHDERDALETLPALITGAGDADGRFDYRAHPDDPDAEERYREIIGPALDEARWGDRSRLAALIRADEISIEDAEAWMRVIGDARLVLAGFLGIEEDGWEADSDPEQSTEMALLTYLGYLQDQLVEVLSVA